MTSSIGIVVPNTPDKGLWRDMQTIVWALATPPVRQCGLRPRRILVFAGGANITRQAITSGLPSLEHQPDPATGSFERFADAIDVAVFFETLAAAQFDALHRARKRVVYIPNLDWAQFGSDRAEGWLHAMRARPWVEIWARQPSIAKELRRLLPGAHIDLVSWSVPDVVMRDVACAKGGPVRLFLNAGNGGFNGRRAVRETLEAYAIARRSENRLAMIVKTIKPLDVRPELLRDVVVHRGFEPRRTVDQRLASADAVIHVSHWEGFGYCAIEALHAGKPVIAHRGWPVGDMVEHEHNGLLINAISPGRMNLTPKWTVDPSELARAMVRIADDDLRDRLTAPEPSELAARQHAFRLTARRLLLREPPARAIVLGGERIPGGPRRSEEYWSDALERHGYEVLRRSWDRVRESELKSHVDLVLVGKIPVPRLKWVRERTRAFVAVWHHDHHAIVRPGGWERGLVAIADLYMEPQVVNEPKHMHVLPGPRSTGDRGYGRRPRFRPADAKNIGVVFLGNPSTDNRGSVIDAVRRLIPVESFGHGQPHAAIYDASADAIYRRARIALSISRVHDTEGYTSNRLYHACANGACVVAHSFPGDKRVVPDGVVLAKDATTIVVTVRALLKSGKWREHARRSERSLWRHHTWTDRVSLILSKINGRPKVGRQTERPKVGRQTERPMPSSWKQYWEERAVKFGALSVTPTSWDRSGQRKYTRRLWTQIRPHLPFAREERVLDYGCGVGRMTAFLTGVCQPVAVDLAPKMVEIARSRGVNALLLAPDGKVPLEDASVDALFTCTVLQHVPDSEIRTVIAAIRRVLRSNAHVVLFENAGDGVMRSSRSGHVVFRSASEYAALFGIELVTKVRHVVNRETHLLLVGRLSEPAIVAA